MAATQHALFNPDLLEEYLQQQEIHRPADTAEIRETVETWTGDIRLTERNLQQAFNADIFGDVLDYRLPRPGVDEFHLFPEELAESGGGFPDILLGQFSLDEEGELEEDVRRVVGELKGPRTDLDKVDPTRLESPVEQGFDQAVRNGLDVRWVVVSNMEEIRLYHHGSIDHYEEWVIDDFIRDGELTGSFWEFYFVMHRDYLLGSTISELLARNLSERLELTEEFYSFYREAVRETYEAILEERPDLDSGGDGQMRAIQAAQKLIHRGLVICFFQDHPSNLLPPDLLQDILQSARKYPLLDQEKIYPALQDLFRVLDTGSPPEYRWDVFGYDGGLFEPDSILDDLVLPDRLFNRKYEVGEHTISGIYGFVAFDFHTDLNEHVLGRIFEESIGDIEQIRENIGEGDDPWAGLTTRSELGVYFTREVLTEFVADQVINDILREKRAKVQEELELNGDLDTENPDLEFLEAYLDAVTRIRIADIAAGSGAFLVSCFEHLSREARSVWEKIRDQQEGQMTLESYTRIEIDILDRALHGNDILPEAIEISKLSVWIRSARKETSLGMLTGNFAVQDALAGEVQFEEREDTAGFGEFDLVIGNPPWGGEITDEAEEWLSEEFSDFDIENLDTYEQFILTALEYLDDGGRLAFVLPHTLINPDHKQVRTHLLENYTFERYHLIGADWFGPDIRMNTTTLQIRNEKPKEGDTFTSMTLVDDDRRSAISGDLGLSQLESAYSFEIPQQRCIESGEIEPFRYVSDDELISTMQSNSIPLGAFCESHRGVELNKAGHIIQCPGCGVWLPPPRGSQPDSEKTCSECGLEFEYQDILAEEHIVKDDPDEGDVLYIDGDSLGARYEPLELKSLNLGYDGIKYKDQWFYEGEKVFIRQAGVGLSVSYSDDLIYCPQSVYIYKIRDERGDMTDWYSDERDKWVAPESVPDEISSETYHKFLLGVLNSRVFHYYVFKRFGEIDAAQAFAKLTQTKIRSLPVPVGKLSTKEGRELAVNIAENVDEMLRGGGLGGRVDWSIEANVRELYGLAVEDMQYINEQMGLVAYHKAMKALYPDGKPSTPERREPIEIQQIQDAPADD